MSASSPQIDQLDYFAGLALTAIIREIGVPPEDWSNNKAAALIDASAQLACSYARAMILHREEWQRPFKEIDDAARKRIEALRQPGQHLLRELTPKE